MTTALLGDRIGALRHLLGDIEERFARPVLTISFGAEDMVLFDLIAREFRGIAAATLDTGRLPPETYELWQIASEQYRFKIEPYYPNTEAIESFVRINGINAFYESVAQRKACCHVRKVEPLSRLLAGRDAWITGLRKAQSDARAAIEIEQKDAASGLVKFNPLADWSEDEVWAYLVEYKVPIHALHAKGYPSIGCAPCTRAIQPGEDVRAGRWWWESESQKECGIHVGTEVAA